MKLLWLFIPNWEQDGMLTTIKSIPKVNKHLMSINGTYGKTESADDDEPFWEQTEACAGFRVSKHCHLRNDEMELVAFQPYEC